MSGLIYAYYHREYTVIGEEVGGQVANGSIGPMYLHQDEFTTKLLKDLELEPNVKVIRIAFISDGEVKTDISPEKKKEYFKKSRALPEDYDTSNLPDTMLNCGKLHFYAYEIDWRIIVDKLKEGVKIIRKNVSFINPKQKVLSFDNDGYTPYEEIISTIPLATLIRICNHNDYSILENTTCDICYATSCKNIYNAPFEYLYVVDKDKPYYRITIEDNGLIVYEFTGKHTLQELQERFPELELTGIKNVPYAKIIDNKDFKDYHGIKLLGRYSQINQRVKTETICKVAQK